MSESGNKAVFLSYARATRVVLGSEFWVLSWANPQSAIRNPQ
jgi:hypothetical protein